jgi:hypothetical protein
MKLYIAGPMSGYPDFNFPAFNETAAFLDLLGYEFVNPAALDEELGLLDAHEDYMQRDLPLLLECDGILLLDGWEQSKGANIELFTALATGKKVYRLDVRPGMRPEKMLVETNAKPNIDVLPLLHHHAANAESTVAFDAGIATAQMVNAGVSLDQVMDEVRTVSATGGAKGAKGVELHALPRSALEAVGKVYHFGAQKYEDYNFRRGYKWSLSYDAMMRHQIAFWDGEDLDPESGLPHMAHVMWHAATLIEFMVSHPDYDDRYRG